MSYSLLLEVNFTTGDKPSSGSHALNRRNILSNRSAFLPVNTVPASLHSGIETASLLGDARDCDVVRLSTP